MHHQSSTTVPSLVSSLQKGRKFIPEDEGRFWFPIIQEKNPSAESSLWVRALLACLGEVVTRLVGMGVTQCSHLAGSSEDQLSEQWKCIFRSVRASCGEAGQSYLGRERLPGK